MHSIPFFSHFITLYSQSRMYFTVFLNTKKAIILTLNNNVTYFF